MEARWLHGLTTQTVAQVVFLKLRVCTAFLVIVSRAFMINPGALISGLLKNLLI